MRPRLRSCPRYPEGVRIGGPVVRPTWALVASLAIGCNAILDWSELHKTPASAKDDDGSSSSSSGETSTSSSSGAGSSSSGQPAPRCDLTKPFGAPVAVAGKVNTASHETAPSLTSDELTMFFQRTVGLDGGDILVSRRASITESWGEPEALPELAGNGADYSPTVTGDGLTLYWSEILSASPRNEAIKIATRATTSAKFGGVRVLDEVSNTTADDGQPYVTPDGTELFFTSSRQNGQRHLFHSVRGQSGFASPELLSGLVAGTAADAQVALTADGLTIFFGSDRAGGLGKSDIWTATRPTRASPFASPAHVDGPVNTADIDWPNWLSADGCRLYLGHLETTTGDILVATRP